MTAAQQRAGSWMQTRTGIRFWPLDPRPDEVDIRDIAAGLARLGRFAGQTEMFYSVAEHSVHCARRGYDAGGRVLALECLLHDAQEAYVGDTVRPLKKFLPDLVRIGDRIQAAVRSRFGLTAEAPPEVHDIDNRMLATEASLLLSRAVNDEGLDGAWWQRPEFGKPFPNAVLPCWNPVSAEGEFLDEFRSLYA